MLQGDVVKDYLEKYSGMSTQTLARLIYKENNSLFNSIETARTRVRYYRGALGNKHRETISDASKHNNEIKNKRTTMPTLPEGITYYQDWKCYNIPSPALALVLADTHIPYHSKESIEIAVPEMGELLIQLAILTNLSAEELEEFQADISKMRISEQAAFVKEVIMQEAVRAARRDGKTPEEVVEEVRLEALRRVSGEEGMIDPGPIIREKEEEAVRIVAEEEPEEEVKPEIAPREDEDAELGEKLSQFELDELRRELESRGVPPHEIDTIMEQARVLPRELVEELVKSLGDRKK